MWKQIRNNKIKSVILVSILLIMFGLTGYSLGYLICLKLFAHIVFSIYNSETSYSVFNIAGFTGMGIAIVALLIILGESLYNPEALFVKSNRAKIINLKDHRLLSNILEEMRLAAGLPKIPKIYLLDTDIPNAYSVGRDPVHACITVTSGLLTKLNRDEIQAVIAHEMAHIKNRDTLYMCLAGSILETITLLADTFSNEDNICSKDRTRTNWTIDLEQEAFHFAVFAIMVICVPFIFLLCLLLTSLKFALYFLAISCIGFLLIKMFRENWFEVVYFTLSRNREYLADACAVQFTRHPASLASALNKISNYINTCPISKMAASMCIVNPIEIYWGRSRSRYSSHPPTDERIKILNTMLGAGYISYSEAFNKTTGKTLGVITASSTTEWILAQEQRVDNISQIDNMRDTTNILWRLNKYIFIHCDCGIILKIPPVYENQKIICPQCSKEHIATDIISIGSIVL